MSNDLVATVRPNPPMVGEERDALRGWLDYHRATLAWKCDQLTDRQLRRIAIPSSTLSLLGLVRHMAEVERHWFQRIIGGATIAHVWTSEWDFQIAFAASNSTRKEAFEAWTGQVKRARSIEAAVDSLDTTFHVSAWECEATLRTLMLHLIHDYARHNGHADLLRQAIDGVSGA